jgi:glucans biosynthesis protein C
VKINIDQRIHGIDALRGIAMLLGILLHATIAYKVHPLPTWPSDPNHSYWAFDYIYFFIHSFRMPLFFLIAGYFCRFLYYRVGERKFIIHRAKRILVPFLVSMVIILPLTIFPFLVYKYSYLDSREGILKSALHQLFQWNGMAHLWFLYFLLIYYFGVILLLRLANSSRLKQHFIRLSKTLDEFILNNFSAVLIVVLPLAVILLMVPELFLHVDTGIIPQIPYLSFFGYFFFLGWVINRNAAKAFSWMAEKTWFFLTVGIALSVFLFWLEFSGRYTVDQNIEAVGIKILASLQIITLVLGSVGFFLRMWQTESKTWKYLSDASYWMYLIHLSLVVTGQVLMLSVRINGVLKFIIILIATMIITLATYHFFIRFSIIGEWLHGKRERLKISRGKSKVLLPKKIL